MNPEVESPACKENELTINLGRTLNGLEFLKIRRLKRKPGCRVYFLERRWNGSWRTIWSWHCLTLDDILRKVREHSLLDLTLSRDVMRQLGSFYVAESGVEVTPA